MYTFLFIACLVILCMYAIQDLHDSVALLKKWEPETRIRLLPRLAYNAVRVVKGS